MDGIAIGGHQAVPLGHIGDQLRPRPRPARQIALACVLAAAVAAAIAVQPPLVVVLIGADDLIGDDKITPVGEEHPPLDIDALVAGVHFGIVAAGAGKGVADKGVVTTAGGLPQ